MTDNVCIYPLFNSLFFKNYIVVLYYCVRVLLLFVVHFYVSHASLSVAPNEHVQYIHIYDVV